MTVRLLHSTFRQDRKLNMKVSSLRVVGSDDASSMREQLRRLERPLSAIIWAADTMAPEAIIEQLHDAAPCVVGGVSAQGLIGGGEEFRARDGLAALAITLPDGATALPFHSATDGLPEFPAEAWHRFATATPAESPHMMLLASPTSAASLERWLSRLDTSLPWATKLGGILAGHDDRLWLGGTSHQGGSVGLALSGVHMDALVCQGAAPVGPAFEITVRPPCAPLAHAQHQS